MELTLDELQVVLGREALLAKNHASAKLKGELETLRELLTPRVMALAPGWDAPEGFDPTASQVAKGEDLLGTPYQYLDFPRYFSRETCFAFRTLVWWGRAVSYSWILTGDQLPLFRERLMRHRAAFVQAGLGVWFGGDLWDWEAFVPLGDVPPDALETLGFLKAGRRVALAEGLAPGRLTALGVETFSALLPLISGR